MDLQKFRNLDPIVKWLLIGLAVIVVYFIGRIVAGIIVPLILGALVCGGAHWFFFGPGKS